MVGNISFIFGFKFWCPRSIQGMIVHLRSVFTLDTKNIHDLENLEKNGTATKFSLHCIRSLIFFMSTKLEEMDNSFRDNLCINI